MLRLHDAAGSVPWSQGAAQFVSEQAGTHRYFVGVRCRLGTQETEELAQLDTASEWSVISDEVAVELGNDLGDAEGNIQLHTRFGRLDGTLRRLRITLLADAEQGADVEVEATVVVLPNWPGPVMLGFRGFLQRLRLGIDPGVDANSIPRIYFGAFVD